MLFGKFTRFGQPPIATRHLKSGSFGVIISLIGKLYKIIKFESFVYSIVSSDYIDNNNVLYYLYQYSYCCLKQLIS